MARKQREWYENACYHVMGRGNRRAAIFKSDEDHIVFLMQLVKLKQKHPFDLHACCLMTNHFHLELTTKNEPIWKIMKPLMQNYAMWFNQRYGYVGHVFDSRYTSCMIEDEIYFLEVSRYIHLNPVKAQMVREPLAYEYSSYGMFVENPAYGKDEYGYKTVMSAKVSEIIKGLVETKRVLDCFRNNPREQYRMFVEGKISHAEQEMLIQKDMKEDDMWIPW